MRYNTRHRTTGHLFGGRYKAVLVEAPDGGGSADADDFSTIIDNIHLSPVRARLIAITEEKLPPVGSYRWSSLPEYCKKRSVRPKFLETSKGIGTFGLKDGPAGRRQFVERPALRAQREKLEQCHRRIPYLARSEPQYCYEEHVSHFGAVAP